MEVRRSPALLSLKYVPWQSLSEAPASLHPVAPTFTPDAAGGGRDVSEGILKW